MNWFLVAASALAYLVGLAHSVLGEWLIFRRMREGGLVPTNGARLIGERHVRILWASWHVLTVFGWCVAAILFWLSQGPQSVLHAFVAKAILVAMLAGATLVFVGTKGKHPGWAGLLGVAALTWFGTGSW
jgi:hypothetical protein